MFKIAEPIHIKCSDANAEYLRDGCYWIRLRWKPPFEAPEYLVGTLRVERSRRTVTISGDLYRLERHGRRPIPPGEPPPEFQDHPGSRLPVYSRAAYFAYVRGESLSIRTRGGLQLGFEFCLQIMQQHLQTQQHSLLELEWEPVDYALQASLKPEIPPHSPSVFPPHQDFFSGKITAAAKSQEPTEIGQLELGWVSHNFRRAVVEIDCQEGIDPPLEDGQGESWSTVFQRVRWQVEAYFKGTTIPPYASFTKDLLHETMLALDRLRPAKPDLDHEWRYSLLCVHRFDDPEGRGVMFDHGPANTNGEPRQGAAVAASFNYGASEQLGALAHRRLAELPRMYLRTAIHEIGHAMSLGERAEGSWIMAQQAEDHMARTSPQGLPLAFHPLDQWLLKHLSDLHVRPGGHVEFNQGALDVAVNSGRLGRPERLHSRPQAKHDEASVTSSDDPWLQIDFSIKVTPDRIPAGAPARVQVSLKNSSSRPLRLPNLSLKFPYIRVEVIDLEQRRSLNPLIRWSHPSQELFELPPGETLVHGMTLLRGASGPLFCKPKQWHKIIVTYRVPTDEYLETYTDEADLYVFQGSSEMPWEGDNSEVFEVLVYGGDHLRDGIAAIHRALDDDVFRRHYQAIEAKRRIRLSQPLKEVFECLEETTEMTVAELRSIVQGLSGYDPRDLAVQRQGIATLLHHARRLESWAPALETEIGELLGLDRRALDDPEPRIGILGHLDAVRSFAGSVIDELQQATGGQPAVAAPSLLIASFPAPLPGDSTVRQRTVRRSLRELEAAGAAFIVVLPTEGVDLENAHRAVRIPMLGDASAKQVADEYRKLLA